MTKASLFTPIEGSKIVFRVAGVYSESTLYVFDSFIYAKRGTGFIKILANGDTSAKNVKYTLIDFYCKYKRTGSYYRYLGTKKG